MASPYLWWGFFYGMDLLHIDMKKILKEWRQFLSEDLSRIRFDNFTGKVEKPEGGEVKVTDRPENQIQTIRSTRQWEIYKRKLAELFRRRMENEAKEKGIDPSRFSKMVNFEDTLENYMDFVEDRAPESLGSVSAMKSKYMDKVLGHAKSPELFQKVQSGLLDKANTFIERMTDKLGITDFMGGASSTKQHEAIHLHLKQIRNAYGEDVYRVLLLKLMDIFGKDNKGSPYDAISRYLLSFESYDSGEYNNYEEVLAWGRQFLNDSSKRKRFKKFLDRKYGESRKIMNDLKSSWKQAAQFASKVEPEDLR